jgi:SAM-dependent methyltransferase
LAIMVDPVQSIDWNDVWKEMRARRTTVQKSASSWGQRSKTARGLIRDDHYAQDFLTIMKPEPGWTVLDMGCGPGILALPLAGLVKQVTAADFSQGMLDTLIEQCKTRNIANVTTRRLAWEDDWQAEGLGTYDAIIASRSLVAEDLKEAIVKLDAAARMKVLIATIVADGPFDRRVFETVGRPLYVGPDYICNYNLLYQMGILASVDFIRQEKRKFGSPAEAFESMSWMLDSMTDKERSALERFVDDHLVKEGDLWVTDYDFAPVWAVIWWEKGRTTYTA